MKYDWVVSGRLVNVLLELIRDPAQHTDFLLILDEDTRQKIEHHGNVKRNVNPHYEKDTQQSTTVFILYHFSLGLNLKKNVDTYFLLVIF